VREGRLFFDARQALPRIGKLVVRENDDGNQFPGGGEYNRIADVSDIRVSPSWSIITSGLASSSHFR